MSFLSTIFLWAIPLIAAPVVVHLYRGRQTEEIDWGAMHFLNAAVTEGRRFERLEELILMALRILAIAALVFAFARPKISSSWLGGGQQSEVILVVDDSLSTSYQIGASEDEGILFDAIKAQAVEQLNQLGTSDRVQVLLASAGGRWLTPEALPCDSANRARLAEQIEELKPSQAATDLLNCVNQCVALESTEGIVQRRIVVFTDEQSHSWSLESKSNWKQTGSVITDATPVTSVQVVLAESPQGVAQPTNLAASEVAANRTVVSVGEKIELRAEVSNFGATASEATEVEWLWDGKPNSNSGEEAGSADEFDDTGKVIGRSKVKPLEPGERTQVTHTVTVKEAGIHLATCRLAVEDPFPLDNTNHVVIQAAKEIPILIVADETEARVSASALLSAALGYSKGKPSDWHSRYRPRIVSLEEFDEISLAEYRVVLFPSLSDVSRSKIEEIASYVRTGGGLWLACGSALDRQVYNADWHDDGAGLSPVRLTQLSSTEDLGEAASILHAPEATHPATRQLADTTQLDIQQARLSEFWEFDRPKRREEQLSVLLETSSGHPLAVEGYFGEGRVIVQALPLGLDWTNLPLLKSYVVMVHDWLDYLSAPGSARHNLSPGSAIASLIPEDQFAESVTVLAPNRKNTEIPVSSESKIQTISYSQTQMPGVYWLSLETEEGSTDVPYHVRRPSEESRTITLSSEEQTWLTDAAHISFHDSTPPEPENSTGSSGAQPFWPSLLIVLLVLLLVELLLAHLTARQRFAELAPT